MSNMMLLSFFAILYGLHLSSISVVQGASCRVQDIYNMSGILSDHANYEKEYMKCWRINVPADNYVRVNFMEMKFVALPCDKAYLDVRYEKVADRFCTGSGFPPNVTTSGNVFMIYYHESTVQRSSFTLQFYTESLNCTLDNHFRCSSHVCIQEDQVCDGVEDCKDGSDEFGCPTGISSIKRLNESRLNAINWLKKQRLPLYGWHKNTQRAITALYLSGGASFQEDIAEEELMVKELELKTAGALLRNSSDPLSVNDLSMLINALLVTCYNPRKFYGYDLVQILSERVATMKSPSPAAYLALCNANFESSQSDEQKLLNALNQKSEYLFYSDIQAMTLMAINCIKNKKHIFFNKTESMAVYNKTIKKFFESQQPDGSFGNVYTSSLVVQALLSSGEEYNSAWDVVAAVKYLIQQLESPSTDIFSTSLVLPILNKKSLVDIGTANCSKQRIGGEVDISDIKDKLGRKIQVKYSLYIGDEKEVIHSVYLKVPVNSSAYDVMRVAQAADPKYKFQYTNVSGHMYIYEIAGITNDAEAGKFWVFYSGDDGENAKLTYNTESPDKFILTDGKQIVLWYRTVYS